MAFAKKDEPIVLDIGGIQIELGKKYVLDHKFDGSAPDGLKSIGATRLPFNNNTLKDCVGFDEERGLYDTGFQVGSACLREYSREQQSVLVPLYVKYIKQPFEITKNVDLSSSENSVFYRNYRYDLYVNQEFDTTNPLQLFDLFNAILQGYVCAKDERNPYYRDSAQFIISNPSDFKNKEKIKVEQRIDAFERFSQMCKDREKLDLVLEYIGRDNPEKIDSKDLKIIYYKVINGDKGEDFADRFIKASDNYETEIGKLEMEYFALVNRLQKTNKIRKDKRGLFTANGDFFLGNSTQDVAKHCLNSSSEQKRIITELKDEII